MTATLSLTDVTKSRPALASPPALITAVGPLTALLSACGFATVLLSARAADPNAINGYGLVSVLPPQAIGALVAIAALSFISISVAGVRPLWRYLQIALLLVALDLLPIIIEPLPHFATAWEHAGFAEYISRTGRVLHATDARFSWPGFFAAVGFLAQAIGVAPLALVRWASLALDLLYALPLIVLIRTFVTDQRQRAFALLLFVIANWVGQDYFAPQGVNYLLYLCSLVVLLRFFGQPATGPLARLFAFILRRREDEPLALREEQPFSQHVAALILSTLLFSASVVSHQLTPMFLLFAFAALVLLRVCRLGWLLLLQAVLVLAYFVWGAEDFWVGHLHDLISNVGAVGNSLQQNLTDRAAGPADQARRWVVLARLSVTAGVVVLAGIGLVRNRTRSLVIPAVLTGAPVVVLGLQSYGGEAALRVYFFALPWLAILACRAVLPGGLDHHGRLRGFLRTVSGMVVVLALMTGYSLARYGNEAFERMRPEDAAAVQFLENHAQRGATVFTLSESVPWREKDIETFDPAHVTHTPFSSSELGPMLAQMSAVKGPAYLLVTGGQWAELHALGGFDAAQIAASQKAIASSSALRALYRQGDVAVYQLVEPSP